MIQEKRPIDANSLYDIIEARYKNAIGEAREKYREVLDLICDQPTLDLLTADVVPKSEVEKWKEINEQLHKEMSERMIEERKIERNLAVAQIIGEMLSNHMPDVDGFFTIHKTELAKLKKKFDPICD